jgi:putative DNA modification/repair radical SAM protein
MRRQVIEKLEILADAAKYDVSCSSSGSKRSNSKTGVGDATGNGICHSYTQDGRCVSLLKILFSNICIYDCAYCVSRRSNDVVRVAFTVEEVVGLTMDFYRRNYIEGLFLSSGIFKDADTTTEKLVAVARTLREREGFNGYIHLKIIPGASDELTAQAARYADRLSVNLEIPSEQGLKHVAPEKSYQDAFDPMNRLRDGIAEHTEETQAARKTPLRKAPKLFAPAGQTTQLVVGATPENDRQVLTLADGLYEQQKLKRVYYSGFVPISPDPRVPQERTAPLVREHRLYQADWLLRFYGFGVDEIVTPEEPDLDVGVDPKAGYALRHPWLFPVDVNAAPYEMIVRIPGVGVRSARRIVSARRHAPLRWEHLQKMGVVMKRAQYFLTVGAHKPRLLEHDPNQVRLRLMSRTRKEAAVPQLDLFAAPVTRLAPAERAPAPPPSPARPGALVRAA